MEPWSQARRRHQRNASRWFPEHTNFTSVLPADAQVCDSKHARRRIRFLSDRSRYRRDPPADGRTKSLPARTDTVDGPYAQVDHVRTSQAGVGEITVEFVSEDKVFHRWIR